MPRRLPTREDVLDAAYWRLRKLSTEQIEAGLAAIDTALASQMNPQEDFGDELIPRDVRNPFSFACAFMAIHAESVGDIDTFWRAGFVVLAAYRQSQRANYPRRGDALDALIRANLEERPEIGPGELWASLGSQATDGFDDVLDDFDEAAEVLTYVPHLGAGLADIGIAAFRRRVQRMRKRLENISSTGLRQEPASVAATRADSPKDPPREAA